MEGTLNGPDCGVIGGKFPFFFIALTFSGTNSPFKVRTDTEPSRGERPLPGISLNEERALARGMRRIRAAFCLTAAAFALAACAGTTLNQAGGGEPPPQAAAPEAGGQIGTGQVRVGLILPLSAQGNAGVAARSMKNAAEMALAEFKNPNIQLLVKDDAGTPQGAQAAAEQALAEGAEIIIGPLFAQAVRAVGARRARARHSGDRVFDRRQRRHQRHLSLELPAGVRR